MTRSSNQTTYTLTGTRLASTEKAIRFSFHAINGTECERRVDWFPVSQMRSNTTDPNAPDSDTIVITEWMAQTKGILEPVSTPPKAVTPKSETHLSGGHFDPYADDFPF